jgi:hypothetical protein
MRSFLVSAAIGAVLLGAGAASAEKRIFIIANHPDGYGVDRCLAMGGSCGAAVANSYCRSRDFEHALSYRKLERDEIAGAVPASASCRGDLCAAFVAIECAR